MSKYTTELRYICESLAGYTESQDDYHMVISTARPLIFNFTYPIYSQAYKPTLETKILMHFYTREIGLETYGLWKMKLDERLNLIMPYYNELYEKQAQLTGFDIYNDVNYTITHEGSDNSSDSGTVANTGSGTSSSSGVRKDAYSDTPQGGLSNVDNLQYLTTYERNDTESSGTTSTTNSGTTSNSHEGENQYEQTVVGKRSYRTYAETWMEFTKAVKNIDDMIINELNDLFMLLW